MFIYLLQINTKSMYFQIMSDVVGLVCQSDSGSQSKRMPEAESTPTTWSTGRYSIRQINCQDR